MGRILHKKFKRYAERILELYKPLFTTDFEKNKKILDAPSIDQTTGEGIPSSCNYVKVSSMYKGEYDWIERYARYTIYGLIILIPLSVFLYHRRGVWE